MPQSLGIQQMTVDAYDVLAKALMGGQVLDDSLRKAIIVATGFSIDNQEENYVNLVPFEQTWFRDRVARNPNAKGSAISWDTLTAIDTNNTLGYVAEGKRAAAIQLTKGAGTAAYAVWGVEDSYTRESKERGASLFGGNQMGIEELCVQNLLQGFSKKDERILFGANRDIDLGTPAAPTAVAASGGTLVADDYWAVVVALTVDGWTKASPVMATGLTKQEAVTSPVGETYNLNAGCSKRGTDSLALAATTNQKLTCSVTAIKGAVAYGWYMGKNTTTIPADSALYLHAVTTTNVFVFGATGGTPYATSGQALSVLALSTTDWSKEATYAPGGIFYQAMNSSDAYWLSMDNGVLTMTNGRVDQFVTLFKFMFDALAIGPESLQMSAATYMKLEELAFGSSNPRTFFVIPEATINNGLTLGGRVKAVINSFTGETVEVVVNRNIPDGLIFGAKLVYAVPGVPSQRSVEVETFGGLWRIDWFPTTRTNFHGAYMHGAIKMYVPGCFGAIGNINTE